MFTKQQIEALSAKLDGSAVKQRSQAGRSLSYIEGWHAIAEANRIFGFDMWHRETVEMRQLGEPRECKIGKAPYEKDGWRVAYMAKVRIEVFAGERCIIREGCGYGSGIDADLGAAHESALKEAETDAMKRALMTFGNPFGLALYDKSQENVERDNGNGHGNGHPKSPPPPAPRVTSMKSAAPPKVPDNSVTDWSLVADDLIADAMRLRSAAEINAMLKDRADQFRAMPAHLQERVKQRVAAHRESLGAMMP